MFVATPALALPQGGQVVGGQASIATSGSQTTITQSSQRGIINWHSFDIGYGEGVHFQQPSSISVTLNRVTGGGGASQLLGNLTANGTVMLVNPQGTFIGPNASVNVGSFLVTTSDISNDRFMAGDYRFDRPGNPNAAIINTGHITVAEGGLAAFVAPNVVNNGLIQARLGKVQLASGDTFALDLYGDGLISLEASDALTSQLVSNGGIIAAEGGKVLMTAAAAGEVVNSLINMDGIISATSIGEQNGEIVIFAEGSNAVIGNDTSKKDQKQGNSTVLVSGILDASGRGEGERGGRITVTGDNVALLDGTLIDASGHTGLSGTTAGKAVSAHREGSAGGDIRIGGDYLGQGGTPTARSLYVDPGALILNDAMFTGDAGRTIVWSDGTTQFYGNVYARALGGKPVDPLTWSATAGGNPGDGGFVETSGYERLDAGGYVNLTASSGDRGTYFLDPTDITIYGNVDPAFQSTDGSIDLASSLKLWLDASDTSQVTLTYSTDGLSAATATGTAGSNTITTSADASANLAVGARIRLGAAGAVTTAASLGADTYTIASISGTAITVTSNLTQNYTGSTLHRGLVSQLADKSGQGNNATQATAANMPLWVSNGQNGLGTASFDGASGGDIMVISSLTPPTAFSFFAATVRRQQTNFGSGTRIIFSGNGENTGPLIGVRRDGLIPSDALQAGWYGGNTTNTMAGTWAIGTAHIVYAYMNSGGGTNNLTLGLSGISSTSTQAATAVVGPSYLGGEPSAFDGTRRFNGNISDAILYNDSLFTNSQDLVNQYESAKWGIALTPPGTGATEVAKATAADGYSAFTTRYLERLSQSADISLQATNNISLDLKGDTLALGSDRNFALTTTSGNISSVSSGTITTTRTSSGGNITMTAGGSGNINLSDVSLNATGGGQVSLSAGGSISVNQPLALNLGTVSGTSVLLRTTGTTSDLTLNGAIAASASGNAITLAAGGNFINNAGSETLSAPSGRWLIYSTSAANDKIGGLASDFRRISCAYGGSCPSFPANGNGFLYSHPVKTIEASLWAGEVARVQLSQQPSLAPSGFVYSPTNGHMEFISAPRPDRPSQLADIGTLSPSFGGVKPRQHNVSTPEIMVDRELQIEFDLPPTL